MGLGNMSFLPETFARYTLVHAKFATLADTLRLSGASDMRTLAAISHNLGMTADWSLGASIYLDLRWRGRGRFRLFNLCYIRPERVRQDPGKMNEGYTGAFHKRHIYIYNRQEYQIWVRIS